jgi:VWFA-related protein
MRRLIGTAVFLLTTAWPFAQEKRDQQPFQTGVELVQLDVSVLDDKREPVRGLTAADFTVLENGVPRPIRAFTAVDIAARNRQEAAPAWAATVVPDVATNQVGAEEGRLVVILMDRSIPYLGGSALAERIAIAAVNEMGPSDLGALISTSGAYTPQNFTADRARLIKAIQQRDWSTESSTFPWSLDEGGDGRCLCGICVLDTVTRVSDALRSAPRRRKVLFFIGRGLVVNSPPRNPKDDPGCEIPLKDARQKLYDSLAISNLTVHSIDPRGLENVGDHTKASVSGAGLDRPVDSGPTMRLRALTTARNDVLRTQESLKILPDRTGGRTIVNLNAPESAMPAIFNESSVYYLVGFERDPAGKGEASRSIEVKVARKGIHAYTQRKYVPLSPAAAPVIAASTQSPALDTMVGGVLPNASTFLALNAVAFARPEDDRAGVLISVDAGGFARETDATVDVSAIVVDQTGRQVASARQSSTIGGRPPTAAGVVDVRTHLELEPGDYELRVALSDAKTGAVGSVFSSLAIPKFTTAKLALSDVVIETGPADQSTGDIAPTTQRTFARGDQVRAFLQIYEGTRRTEAITPVSVRVRILDARGQATRDQAIVFAEKDFQGRHADCRINLPLDRLAAGEYLLEMTASAGEETAERKVRFAVR